MSTDEDRWRNDGWSLHTVPQGHDDIATAIITGQLTIIGALAITLANDVDGIDVADDGAARVEGGVAALEALVRAYSTLTGALGIRMCHTHARSVLSQHPDIVIPSFASL